MNGFVRLLIIVVSIALPTITMFSMQVASQTPATTSLNPSGIYYVDKNNLSGSCSPHNTGTISDPFCSLAEVFLPIRSGLVYDMNVTVIVRQGTYSDPGNYVYWMPASSAGIIENYTLHIKNYPGDSVIISGMGASWGLHIMGDNIIVEGLEITNFTNHGIYSDTSNSGGSVQILNSIIHGCVPSSYTCTGINVNGGSGHTIKGNEIYGMPLTGSTDTGGIRLLNAENSRVEANTVHGNSGFGISVAGNNNIISNNKINNHYPGGGIRLSGEDNIVLDNFLFDNRLNVLFDSCEDCVVSGNLIYSTVSNLGTGIRLMDSPGAGISGNTIAFLEDHGIVASMMSTMLNQKNNIIYGIGYIPLKLEYNNSGIYQYYSNHNLYNSASGGTVFALGKMYGHNTTHSLVQYQSDTGQDIDSLFQTDPLFVDESSFDFTPSAGSPVCSTSDTGGYIGALPCEAGSPQPPTICAPNWTCTGWHSCINGTEHRNCYDWNSCGDNTGKPAESQTCTSAPATTTNTSTPTANTTDNTSGNATTANITGTQNATNATQPPPAGSDTDVTVIMPGINDSGPAAADQPVVVIDNFTSEKTQIAPDEPKSITIHREKIGLSSIKINVRNSVSDVSISVERVSSAPVPVQPKESEIIYQYLNITHENVEDTDIDLVIIYFDVSSDWINDNNANISDIYLSRYVVNQWVRLPTRLVNQSDEKVFFKALSPGLSMFSIMAGSVLSGSNKTCVPYDIRCVGNRREQCDTSGMSWQIKEDCEFGCSETTGCLESPDEQEGDPWTLMVIIIVVIMLLAVLGFYFNSKREGLTNEIREMQSYR
jgi:PGF-pre-PGF domain-containing protein